MKKLLALILSLALLAGVIPALAESAAESVPLPAAGDVVEGFEVKEIRERGHQPRLPAVLPDPAGGLHRRAPCV